MILARLSHFKQVRVGGLSRLLSTRYRPTRMRSMDEVLVSGGIKIKIIDQRIDMPHLLYANCYIWSDNASLLVDKPTCKYYYVVC